MKKILSFILFLWTISSFAQFTKAEYEVMEIVKKQDSLPRTIFLDTSVLPDMNVWESNTRNVWSSKNNDKKSIETLYDIRLRFPNHDSAIAFYKKYLIENAEFGKESTTSNLKFNGTEVFNLFYATEALNKLMAPYKLHMFCFIFVINNYFVKLHITCNKEFQPDKFQYLIDETVKRLKS